MTTPAGAVAGNAEAAQDEAGRRERRAGGQGFFQRKYGPLPGWGWAVLAGVGAIGYFWWRNRSSAQAAASQDSTATDTSGGTSGDTAMPDEAANLQGEIDALNGQVATDTSAIAADQKEDKAEDKKAVPKVEGLRVNTAIAKLKAAGFKHKLSEPRKPGVAYKVKSQSPAAGSKHDPATTTVDLTIERDHPDRRKR